MPHPDPVELDQRRECDVVDVEVQAHADGIRRHEVIDVAVLVHVDLRVARARRQSAHHDRRPALGPAQEFGDGIDIFDREPDDGSPFRHPAELFRT